MSEHIATLLESEVVQKVGETTGNIVMTYFKAFLTNPFIIGLGTLFVVVLIGFILKQVLDFEETKFQNIVWFGVIHFGVFILTLLALIALDLGEVVLKNKLFG